MFKLIKINPSNDEKANDRGILSTARQQGVMGKKETLNSKVEWFFFQSEVEHFIWTKYKQKKKKKYIGEGVTLKEKKRKKKERKRRKEVDTKHRS